MRKSKIFTKTWIRNICCYFSNKILQFVYYTPICIYLYTSFRVNIPTC